MSPSIDSGAHNSHMLDLHPQLLIVYSLFILRDSVAMTNCASLTNNFDSILSSAATENSHEIIKY